MHPFREGDTHTTFESHIENITREINSLDNEYILKASKSELENYYVGKVLIAPLILHSDERYIKNQSGTQIDVRDDFRREFFSGEKASIRGTKLEIAIPFEGDPILWKIRASTFTMGGYPEITIDNNEIIFNKSFSDNSADSNKLRSDIDSTIKSFETAVGYLKNDVVKHNNSAPDKIKQTIERKIQLAQSSTGAIAALGIPVKRVNSAPTFSIPTKRREKPISRPIVETGQYKPEPILEEKEYQHILEILRSMSLVIERNPSSFSVLDEESIRDHFLIQLNGHYEGSATGETFNASGKTDILIREENRNVFIAECKFWRGQKGFNDAIDQLLSYLTWRDSKCALLIFNKTQDSNAVKDKMHEVMEARLEHRKTIKHTTTEDSRYIFIKEAEPGREIIITTQIYNIPDKIYIEKG